MGRAGAPAATRDRPADPVRGRLRDGVRGGGRRWVREVLPKRLPLRPDAPPREDEADSVHAAVRSGRSRARKWLRLPRVHVLREAEPCRRLVSPDEDLQQVDDPRSPEHGSVAPPESTPSDPGAAQGLGDPSPWALRLLRDPVQPGSMLDAPMACRTTLEEVAESPLPAPLDDLVRVQQAAETVPTSSTSSTPTGAAESVDCEPLTEEPDAVVPHVRI